MARRFGTIRSPGIPLRQELLPLADPFFAEALFDATPDIVFFVKNARGQYVAVNDTLVRRLGLRSKSDLIGRTAADVFPGPLGASYAAQDQHVLASRAEIKDRLELHLYDQGTRGWCLTYKRPLLGLDGRVKGMAGFSRDLHQPDERRSAYRSVARAVDHLQAHFSEPLKVGALALHAGLPAARFARLVRRIFQLTPGQLLVKTRLDAASDLLLSTRKSVAEIAQTCGYSDHSAFTRQFRATVGLTPSQFRDTAPG
jgi:PAS domain S-box-containing protein